MTKRSSLSASLAVVAAAGALGTGIALAAGTHQASSGVTVGVKHTSLGSILYAGSKHRTVYMYTKDHGTRSACSGACAQYWPAVTTVGKPKAGSGAVASDLGTAKQHGGVTQVTYKGHLLYYYAADTSASSTSGQGFQHLWYVLSASGSKMTGTGATTTPTTTTSGTTSTGGGGGGGWA
jgi:predicted lipoprotein with Yx(FWY)xxD motif